MGEGLRRARRMARATQKPPTDPIPGPTDPLRREVLPPTFGFKDPRCPKCGITLGNKMMYACGYSFCPVGLN